MACGLIIDDLDSTELSCLRHEANCWACLTRLAEDHNMRQVSWRHEAVSCLRSRRIWLIVVCALMRRTCKRCAYSTDVEVLRKELKMFMSLTSVFRCRCEAFDDVLIKNDQPWSFVCWVLDEVLDEWFIAMQRGGCAAIRVDLLQIPPSLWEDMSCYDWEKALWYVVAVCISITSMVASLISNAF